MKITIINPTHNHAHLHDTIDGNIWSSTAGCFFKRTCSSCPFYTHTTPGPCYALRDRFITAVAPTTFPHTFDTDDYPELLI